MPVAPGTASTGQRFEALDSLRGICALLVCLFHFKATGPLVNNLLIRDSWVFVDFFFVLSGFVICHSYGSKLGSGMSLTQFAGLRFMRLYPLHLVMLLMFLAVEIAGAGALSSRMLRSAFEGPYSLKSFLLNLTLLHSLGFYDELSWNHPSWSIAVEYWTYLLFGAVVILASLHVTRIAAVVVVVAAALLLVVTDRGINVTHDFGMVRCMYGFGLGVLGYAVYARAGPVTDRLSHSARTILEVAGLAFLVVAIHVLAGARTNLLLPLLFTALVLLFAGQGGAVARLLRHRVPLYLGAISYSIYMVHAFVQARLEDFVRLIADAGGPDLLVASGSGHTLLGRSDMEGTVLVLVMLVTVLAASALAYRLVEQPGIRLGRGWFRFGAAPVAVAPPAPQ